MNGEKIRKRLPARIRWRVLERAGGRCELCGAAVGTPGVTLTVDHIIPLSQGGSNALSNLRALCAECNNGKGRELPFDADANANADYRRFRPSPSPSASTSPLRSCAKAKIGRKKIGM
jgi:5-methylcytosine-specific restriction endonuclease McrA